MRNSDEQSSVRHFRAENRFFRVENQWFYSTREGQEGPFPSKEAAQRHLRSFLDLQQLKKDAGEKVEKMREEHVPVDHSIWDRQIDII